LTGANGEISQQQVHLPDNVVYFDESFRPNEVGDENLAAAQRSPDNTPDTVLQLDAGAIKFDEQEEGGHEEEHDAAAPGAVPRILPSPLFLPV
jgi:hypothetical protein